MQVRGGGPIAMVGRIDRWHRIANVLVLTLSTTGCASSGPTPSAFADLRGTTIAFESIEGPPAAVSQRFARNLNEETSARQIVVVPAGGQAQYRIRGYLAAQPTSIAWAWDVYDATQQRAFRLRGEEQAAGRRSWAGADDAVLRRIARASVEQFAGFLAADRTPASPETRRPARSPSVIAASGDLPEAPSPDVPLPRYRPAPNASSAALAYTAQ